MARDRPRRPRRPARHAGPPASAAAAASGTRRRRTRARRRSGESMRAPAASPTRCRPCRDRARTRTTRRAAVAASSTIASAVATRPTTTEPRTTCRRRRPKIAETCTHSARPVVDLRERRKPRHEHEQRPADRQRDGEVAERARGREADFGHARRCPRRRAGFLRRHRERGRRRFRVGAGAACPASSSAGFGGTRKLTALGDGMAVLRDHAEARDDRSRESGIEPHRQDLLASAGIERLAAIDAPPSASLDLRGAPGAGRCPR